MSGPMSTTTSSRQPKSSPSSSSTTTAVKKRKPTPEEAAFNAKLKDQSSLRFISAKVCEIVENKVTTTYNEVANELVIEALKLFDIEKCSTPKLNSSTSSGSSSSRTVSNSHGHSSNGNTSGSTRKGAPILTHTEKKKKDHEKNIRRRVYDALNVLLATDIISKTKEKGDREKSIHWKGYPTTTSADLVLLEKEKDAAIAEIERKKECLQELLVQNVCFRNLERRNKRMKLEEEKVKHEGGIGGNGNGGGGGSVNDSGSGSNNNGGSKNNHNQGGNEQEVKIKDEHGHGNNNSNSHTDENKETDEEKIYLPFIVVNTAENATIKCEMNQDKTDVMFDFNMPFEINDDNEILKRLGL